MTTLTKTARTAGALYLVYVIVQILADVLGRSGTIAYGEEEKTALEKIRRLLKTG